MSETSLKIKDKQICHERVHFSRGHSPLPLCSRERVGALYGEDIRSQEFVQPTRLPVPDDAGLVGLILPELPFDPDFAVEHPLHCSSP
jgi:hypothetical protein